MMPRTKQKPLGVLLERKLTDLGHRAKMFREAQGLSQEESVQKSGITLSGLRDIEQGYETRTSNHILNADALGVSFGYGAAAEDIDIRNMIRELASRMEYLEATMQQFTRRQLTKVGALMLFNSALPEPVRALFLEPGFPPLSESDLEILSAHCDGLDMQYRALGGGAVLGLATDMHSKAMTWYLNGAYPDRVKRALGVLCAQLKSWIGWFAFDEELLASAEHHLNEAITMARISGSPQVEIHALDNLCALMIRQHRHDQALYTAEAGLAACPDDAHRTRAVFHLRGLTACALRGDVQGFQAQLESSRAQLDRGPTASDSSWNDWANEFSFRGSIGKRYVELGQPAQGAELLWSALEHPSYRSRQLRESVWLGQALVARGSVAEAGDHALALLPDVMEFQSNRLHRNLYELYRALYEHRSIPQAQAFVEAYDNATSQASLNA